MKRQTSRTSDKEIQLVLDIDEVKILAFNGTSGRSRWRVVYFMLSHIHMHIHI